MAGFMTIVTKELFEVYENAIINIHPALIPSFAGPGCFGLHVHEKALACGVKVSGATVHFVTEECDAGPIILQRAVDVLPDDTPETLQRRIMEQCEWKLLPRLSACSVRTGCGWRGVLSAFCRKGGLWPPATSQFISRAAKGRPYRR